MIAETIFNRGSLDKIRKPQSQRTTQFITMPIRLSNMPLNIRGRKTIPKLPFRLYENRKIAIRKHGLFVLEQ